MKIIKKTVIVVTNILLLHLHNNTIVLYFINNPPNFLDPRVIYELGPTVRGFVSFL